LPVWQKLVADPGVTSAGWALLWTTAIGVALAACWHRAREYKRYQIEELVATVAHWLALVGRRELEGSGSGTVASRAGDAGVGSNDDEPSSGESEVP
jgi:hypothetical protein